MMSNENDLNITSMHVIGVTPALPEEQSLQYGRISDLIAEPCAEASDDQAGEKAQFHCLLDSIVDGVLISDEDGRILNANARCCSLLQMETGEICKLSMGQLVSGATETLMEELTVRLEELDSLRLDAALHRKDGEVTAFSIFTSRMTNGDGAPHYCFFLREPIDEDPNGDGYGANLRNAQAASTVAGQIAHDFDNLLTPLFNYPEMIRKELSDDSPAQKFLDTIERTAVDMKNITQQLLAISRRGRTQLRVFNVNETVEHTVELLAMKAQAKSIEVHVELDEDLLQVEGTPEQVLRVIQNLHQNAVDALEEGGRIDVETQNVYIDRPVRHLRELEVGEYVRIRISDNGPGIPYEIREKIFDPFFTTRVGEKKGGSGLGLSVVKGIITDHHGVVDLRSTVGKGTSFDLYIPACRSEDDVPEIAPTASGEIALIVDDDPRQREILSAMFSAQGYRVSSVASAERALEVMSERVANSEPDENGHVMHNFPDLIVLDAVMDPGMDGREACSRILEMNPKQQIIVVSGYATPDEIGISRMLGSISYLKKPVIWRSLAGLLELSASKPAPTSETAAPVVAADLEPCNPQRMLIVDDEDGICRLFKMILSSAFPKVHIDVAPNGAEGIELFQEGHHAVLVMDLQMPVMDGTATFSRMGHYCDEKNWAFPSIVFCTGFAPPSVVKKIVSNNHMHCILTKPISGDDLVLAVRKRLSS